MSRRSTFTDHVKRIVTDETARSRHRDRASGARIHPITADIRTVIHSAVFGRSVGNGDELRELAMRAMSSCDTRALRALAFHVLETRGDRRIRAACHRAIGYCDDIEKALLLRDALTHTKAETEAIH